MHRSDPYSDRERSNIFEPGPGDSSTYHSQRLHEESWYRGYVKWFNPVKRFGFLISSLQKSEIFFHQSNVNRILLDQLKPNLQVWFRIRITSKGLEGYDVRSVDLSPVPSTSLGSRSVFNWPNVSLPSLYPVSSTTGRIRTSREAEKRKARRFRCYNCGQYASHKAATCPFELMTKCCYRCRDPTHLVAQCPYQLSSTSTQTFFESHSFPGPSSRFFMPFDFEESDNDKKVHESVLKRL